MTTALVRKSCHVAPISRPVWRELAPSFHDYNYRQVWEYGEIIAQRHGAVSEHVAVRDGGRTLAIADVRIRRLPMIGGGVAYIGGGPLTRRGDSADEALFQAAVEALSAEYVDSRGLSLRLMCPLGSESWNQNASRVLGDLRFTPARYPKPYRTIAVDTRRPLDSIRDAFSKNWKKNLRRGEQRGVTVSAGRERGRFNHVQALYHELLTRKGFDVELDADFFMKANTAMVDAERFTVILTECDGAVCGMNVVSALGDTLHGIIGATTYEGAKRYAAYLLEWEAIKFAHDNGFARYDLGGIDPIGNPGGYDFKRGTRGEEITAVGPMEKKPAGARGAIVDFGERVYRMLRSTARAAKSSKFHDANGAEPEAA